MDAGLQTLNRAAGSLHLTALVLAVWFLYFKDEELGQAAKIPLYRTSYTKAEGAVNPDPTDDDRHPIRIFLKKAGSMDLRVLILFWFGITTLAHFYYSDLGNARYEKLIGKGNNHLRYVEYAASASVMVVLLGVISNVKDPSVLAAIGVATAGYMLMGVVTEGTDDRTRRIAYVAAWLVLAATWTPIIYNFILSVGDGRDAGYDIPEFVDYAVYIQALFFICFGLWNLYCQEFKKKKNFRQAEKGYIILSFASKAVLGGILAWGISQMADRNDQHPVNE